MEEKGHTVDLCVCPEKEFYSYAEERRYKIPKENSGNYGLAIELHLNAYDLPTANGTEVLYCSAKGLEFAKKILKPLGEIFKNRGAKCASSLYFLNQTKAPAVIIETFFCTSKSDYEKARGAKNCKKIATAIAKNL